MFYNKKQDGLISFRVGREIDYVGRAGVNHYLPIWHKTPPPGQVATKTTKITKKTQKIDFRYITERAVKSVCAVFTYHNTQKQQKRQT